MVSDSVDIILGIYSIVWGVKNYQPVQIQATSIIELDYLMLFNLTQSNYCNSIIESQSHMKIPVSFD